MLPYKLLDLTPFIEKLRIIYKQEILILVFFFNIFYRFLYSIYNRIIYNDYTAFHIIEVISQHVITVIIENKRN